MSNGINISIADIEFACGKIITLGPHDLLVMVGPNNSGKSATLREIRAILREDEYRPKVISVLTVDKSSTAAEIEHLYAKALKDNGRYEGHGFSFLPAYLTTCLHPDKPGIGSFLTDESVSDLTTRMRLADCDVQVTFDARQPFEATHPFHRMYRDVDLEIEASSAFRRAFKQDLVIHRQSGSVIPAYVGNRPKLEGREKESSRSYLERIEALQPLDQQGDGMRSFASVICRVITEQRPIQLIDEPEAFLHPPQAKLVGQMIAEKGLGRQTIVATHSVDVLQGILGAGREVSVVRLTRTPSGSGEASVLESEKIRELWKDPILRFSNVMDGLFHHGVILTEADGDCRFYEALAEALPPDDRRDILYTYCGGKDRVPVIVRALRALQVPVVSVLDFDVLNNENPLRKIVQAYGGKWKDFESNWQIVKGSVEADGAFLSGDKLKAEIAALLKAIPAKAAAPREVLSAIKKSVRNASPWDRVKSGGLTNIQAGPPTRAAKALLADLQKLGIFVVPGGEMESFCKDISLHGPKWVEQALQRDVINDAEFRSGRDFVASLFKFFD